MLDGFWVSEEPQDFGGEGAELVLGGVGVGGHLEARDVGVPGEPARGGDVGFCDAMRGGECLCLRHGLSLETALSFVATDRSR